jgi:hypothetical protein
MQHATLIEHWLDNVCVTVNERASLNKLEPKALLSVVMRSIYVFVERRLSDAHAHTVTTNEE